MHLVGDLFEFSFVSEKSRKVLLLLLSCSYLGDKFRMPKNCDHLITRNVDANKLKSETKEGAFSDTWHSWRRVHGMKSGIMAVRV